MSIDAPAKPSAKFEIMSNTVTVHGRGAFSLTGLFSIMQLHYWHLTVPSQGDRTNVIFIHPSDKPAFLRQDIIAQEAVLNTYLDLQGRSEGFEFMSVQWSVQSDGSLMPGSWRVVIDRP